MMQTVYATTLIVAASLMTSGCGPGRAELAQEIAELKGSLQQRDQALKSKNEESAAAQAQVQSLQSELAAVQSTLNRDKALAVEKERALSEELSTLKAQIETSQSAIEQERKTHDSALALLRNERDRATEERATLARELASLQERAQQMNARLSESRDDLKAEQGKASALTDRLAAAIRESGELRTASDNARAEIDSIQHALAQAQTTVARLTGARGIYTVQDGDTLSSIALYFYRNAHRWPAIAEANKHLVNHPDRIFPAMVLIVPK